MKKLIAVFMILMIWNCTSEVKVINPKDNIALKLPVINAFINAGDSIISITVDKILPFNEPFKSDESTIKNAIIEITIDNKNKHIIPISKTGEYKSKILFLGGETVSLVVKINDKTYSSVTSIPKKPRNAIFKKDKSNKFNITWEGEKDSIRYYELYKIYSPKTKDLYFSKYLDDELAIKSKLLIINYVGVFNIYSQRSISENELMKLYGNIPIEYVIYSSNRDFFEYYDNNKNLEPQFKSSISTKSPSGNFKNAYGFFGAFNSTKFYINL